MINQHEKFMQRALDLAKKGMGNASPNPMVGCVVVHNGEIIGEGYHQKFGEAHAEVNAIKAIKDIDLLPKSTLYVSLEPCSHTGKTPPCANLIIRKNIHKVVIAMQDPNPLVAGRGIGMLKEAGIEVELGVLKKEAEWLNRRFVKCIETKKPYVILKWAETADGFIARANYDSKWISNENSRTLVHKLRAEEDAIMVGANTVKHDNPTLNVRDWVGKNPTRIIVDSHLQLSEDKKVFDGSIPTYLYHFNEHTPTMPHQKKYGKGINKETFLESMLDDMYQNGIGSVLVEGGASLLTAFFENNLWDEAFVFKSSNTFGNGIKAPSVKGKLLTSQYIDNDLLMIYSNNL